MGFLTGKRALIVGVASNRSIAHGIANAMHSQGAQLAFTYQNERLEQRVRQLAADLGSDLVLECDVDSDAKIDEVFGAIEQRWGSLDIIVHAVAFAPRDSLKGDYLSALDRDSFRNRP